VPLAIALAGRGGCSRRRAGRDQRSCRVEVRLIPWNWWPNRSSPPSAGS